ncbi:MAG: hypothetical protein AB7E32_16805 [Desulfovibrio sp.]
MEKPRQIDILDMPFEGLAAYWLSIKKLTDAKKIRPILEEELAHTGEPFVRFLLEAVFSGLDSPTVRRLAEARRDKLLRDYRRKLDMMRVTLVAVPARENPRVTLVRMNGLFPVPPMEEKRAIDMAGALAQSVQAKEGDLPTLLEVDHKTPPDRLLVKLLFYAMYARHHKRLGLERFLPYARTPFFADGLSLVVDGFDPRFLERHLQLLRDEILDQATRKMDMATEMALAVREKLSYEDVHLIARAWLP